MFSAPLGRLAYDPGVSGSNPSKGDRPKQPKRSRVGLSYGRRDAGCCRWAACCEVGATPVTDLEKSRVVPYPRGYEYNPDGIMRICRLTCPRSIRSSCPPPPGALEKSDTEDAGTTCDCAKHYFRAVSKQ